MPDTVYKKQFPVHSYELDFEGRARLVSLLNFLQDAAGDHAALLGWSVTDLLKRNMTWVLSRTHVRVFRYPAWGERVEVTTWPSGRKGYFALRDYEMSDGDGSTVLVGTSSWMVLGLERKQPVKIDDILPDFVLGKRALEDPFASLPALDEADREVRFHVEMDNLDLNRHVNNAVYVRWALESVPAQVPGALRPFDLEVAYRAEALYGDPIVARSRAVEPTGADPDAGESAPARVFLHQIVNPATGVELTRLRSRWK